MRRNPAASSKVLGPRPGTFLSAVRERNGPWPSRWATILAASDAPPRDLGQQGRGGGVHVDADRVHRVLHHRREGRDSFALADIVLVLADADRLRVDLHEFGEGVLQPAGDRHRPPVRHVEVRQFPARDLRGRIDRGTRLGDRHLGHPEVGVGRQNLGGKAVGLAGGGAVADGQQLHLVPPAEAREGLHGILPAALRLVG